MKFPKHYVELCKHWHSGQDCMMYAVASTGGLSLGTDRPRDCHLRPMSDGDWLLYLWRILESDVERTLKRAIGMTTTDEIQKLLDFYIWVKKMKRDCAIALDNADTSDL